MEKDIIKKFENFCEDLYYWVDDDMGGHFETVVGNQIANTMLGYLSYKGDLENLLTRYKQLEEENVELRIENSAMDTVLEDLKARLL